MNFAISLELTLENSLSKAIGCLALIEEVSAKVKESQKVT